MRRKRLLFGLTTAALCFTAVVVVGELLVRLLAPTASLYPRYEFSAEYGMLPFADARMIHTKPGQYRFEYSVNSHGHRGVDPGAVEARGLPLVVVLGDSNAFGMGVADGEEFPRQMANGLDGRFQVMNLGAPGWGLTQEIRRYYDKAASLEPDVVVLQFCQNDLDDNLKNRVTVIEDQEFRFRDSTMGVNWTKKYLSRSPLQRSQLYNFLRQRAYLIWKRRHIERAEQDLEASAEVPAEASPKERFHADLLRLFAQKLKEDGVRLVLISVNDHLESFPHLAAEVAELDGGQLLEYLDVRPWFAGVTDYGSAEGHEWGARAHAIVGAGLARYLSGPGAGTR